MSEYQVVDLSADTQGLQAFGGVGKVDVDQLRTQLTDIRDSLAPLMQEEEVPNRFGLTEMEIALSVSVEGKILFVAKGAAEATIKLTFGRPESD